MSRYETRLLPEREYGAPPGLIDVLYRTASIPMDHYSAATIEAMAEFGSQEEATQRFFRDCQRVLQASCPGSRTLPTLAPLFKRCFIHVSFDDLDPSRRERFLAVPTTFSLPKGNIDALIEVGQELLDRSADFQRLLKALRSEQTGGAGEVGNCS